MMEFDELVNNIEEAKGDSITEHELKVLKKIWNACVECIANEWPVLGDQIRELKQS